MKKIYFVSIHIIALLFICGFVYQKTHPPKKTGHPWYETMLTMTQFKDSNVPNNPIVFIGDSITQGFVTSTVTDRGVNLGIGSDTTAKLLKRLKTYSSIKKAEKIVLCIGTNDILGNQPQIKIIENLKKIITSIPTETPIVMIGILPLDEKAISWVDATGFNQKITQINSVMEKHCNPLKNVTFVLPKSITILSGSLNPKYHIGDGIHLNTTGYRIGAKQLKKILSKSNSDRQSHR